MPMEQNITVQRYLMNIYGINTKKAKNITEQLGISHYTKYSALPEHKKDILVQAITQLRKKRPGLDADLKLAIKNNIDLLMDLQTYRGIRHRKGYPTRGQRTRSNARSAKLGNRLMK